MEEKNLDKYWHYKRECHKWFDSLWRNHDEREVYYQKLADYLGIPKDKCHFSSMTQEQYEKSIEIIKKWWFEKYDK